MTGIYELTKRADVKRNLVWLGIMDAVDYGKQLSDASVEGSDVVATGIQASTFRSIVDAIVGTPHIIKSEPRGLGGEAMDQVMVPKSLGEGAGKLWEATFRAALAEGCDCVSPEANAALIAWRTVREHYTREKGVWTAKAGENPCDGLDAEEAKARGCKEEPEPVEEKSIVEKTYSDEYLNRPVVRPDHVSSNEWARLPLTQRTIGAQMFRSEEARTYFDAIERAKEDGWKIRSNPSRSEEKYLQKWIGTPDGMVMVRALLVRKADNLDWYIKEVSRGHSATLAVRVAPDERRYQPIGE